MSRWAYLIWILLAACSTETLPSSLWSSPLPVAGPGSQVQFLSYPAQKNVQDPGTWGPVLTDIETHLPASYGSTYYDSDRVTHAHETTHGINSHIRNTIGQVGDNAFYVLQDRAIVLPEPNMTKSQVPQFVPYLLRGSRFNLYLIGQTAWDNEPLYLFDEWVSYNNGGAVAVDLHKSGKWSYGWRDGVAGVVEFCVYATATAMAIEQHDPLYLSQTPQFLEFFAWELSRAMDIFREGKDMSSFAWVEQDTYYNNLQSSVDAAPLRSFLTKHFGSTFMQQVLGLVPGPAPDPDASLPPPMADSGPPPPQMDGGSPPLPPQMDGGSPPLPPQMADSGPPPPQMDGGSPLPQMDGEGSPAVESSLVGGCSMTRSGPVTSFPLAIFWTILCIIRQARTRSAARHETRR